MYQHHYLVPEQLEGLKKDITESLAAVTIEVAEDLFVDAKERLLDVNNWKRYSADANATFTLTDSHGNTVKRRARRGDHIRIDAPGAGIDGSGFDWAAIEAIEYDDYPDVNMETFAMRLRACFNPMHKTGMGTGHYPEQDATSTLVIERLGRKVYSTYHGRNEFEEDVSAHSASRHVLTVAPCAWLGLSDIQCTALIKGFIQ
jgi:hypothetical protein